MGLHFKQNNKYFQYCKYIRFVQVQSDYTSTADLVNAHKKLAEQVEAEGCVLLKNINNSLPLVENAKITLLGACSNYPHSYAASNSTTAVTRWRLTR